jgi:hypothetical protein
VNNSNDNSSLWWWICTGVCTIAGIWLANLTFGRGKVIAQLESIIAEQDKIIDEQNEKLKKLIGK